MIWMNFCGILAWICLGQEKIEYVFGMTSFISRSKNFYSVLFNIAKYGITSSCVLKNSCTVTMVGLDGGLHSMSVWCMLKNSCTVTMVGLDGGLHSMSVWCMLKKCCTVTMVGLDGGLHSMSFL